MTEGENRSDMFSQQRAQRLRRRREGHEQSNSNTMMSSEKSDYVEGERTKEAIWTVTEFNTSSEKGDYT